MKTSSTLFVFCRLIVCLAAIVIMVYVYIDRQNSLIELRIKARHQTKELRKVEEMNRSLHYEVDLLKNPIHLMELAKKPTYSYLKYPLASEILLIDTKSSPPAD